MEALLPSSLPQKRPIQDEHELDLPVAQPIGRDAATPQPDSMQQPLSSPLSSPPNYPADANIPSSTTTIATTSNTPTQPAKRRKLTQQEKEDQRLEKEAKAKAREEKKAQKAAEDKIKAEQKAQKDEEKRKKMEERDEKKRIKEEEQHQKEEEKAKKERVSTYSYANCYPSTDHALVSNATQCLLREAQGYGFSAWPGRSRSHLNP
jgi:chromatin assembly factor 1 subunit A